MTPMIEADDDYDHEPESAVVVNPYLGDPPARLRNRLENRNKALTLIQEKSPGSPNIEAIEADIALLRAALDILN